MFSPLPPCRGSRGENEAPKNKKNTFYPYRFGEEKRF